MNLEANKSTEIAFYDPMFNQREPGEVIRRYGGGRHNPMVADGKDAFSAYFERMAHEYSGSRAS